MTKVISPARIAAPVLSFVILAAAPAAWSQTPSANSAELPAVAPSLADRDGNRLSDGLEARLAGLNPRDALSVVVTFATQKDAAAAALSAGPMRIERRFRTVPGFAATMTAGQARAVAARAGVGRVEEDVLAVGQLDVSRSGFGVDRVQNDPVDGGLGLDGAGITVCVVDSGILASHEQFTDGGVSKVTAENFVDFVNGRPAPYDDNGHGTVIAGIIAGDGSGSPLADGFRGVAPAATLYVAKVLDETNVGPISTIIAGIEWCAASPEVDVINLSLTTFESSDGRDALSLAANAAVQAGKVVMAAAGNFGAAPETIGAPGAAVHAITVGAAAEAVSEPTEDWHSSGVYLAPFSSRGPTADGRVKPDIAAPGVTVAAAGTGGPQGIENCTGCYEFASGTSMATAFASGVAALMLQAGQGNLAPADVAQILFQTAQPRGLGPGKNNEWGFGLLDAYAAARQADGDSPADYVATLFPAYARGTGHVDRRGVVRLPIEIVDPDRPLAVSVISDGRLFRRGWRPNLDVELLDELSVPLGAEEAIGTCPEDDGCGLAGRQETVHLSPDLASRYVVEIRPDPDPPTRGARADFLYELSNARSDFDIGPAPDTLVADAGPDQRVRDADKNGAELILLDGSASGPRASIASWVWNWTDATGDRSVDGIAPTVPFPAGEHAVTLTVTDIHGLTASDGLVVTVRGRGGPNGGGASASAAGSGGGSASAASRQQRPGHANFNAVAVNGTDADGDSPGQRGPDAGSSAASARTALAATALQPRKGHFPSSAPTDRSAPRSMAARAVTARDVPAEGAPTATTTEPRDGVDSSVIADAGADSMVIEAGADGMASVALDGTASRPRETVASWNWSWVDGNTGVTFTVAGAAPIVRLPVGEHEITLEVTDVFGAVARSNVTVTVAAGPTASAEASE